MDGWYVSYYSGFFHRLPPQVLIVASEASAVASSSTLLSSPPTLPSAGVHADAAARAELARLARELLEAREDLQRDEGGCAPNHPMRRAVARLMLQQNCVVFGAPAPMQIAVFAGTCTQPAVYIMRT